MTQNGKAEPPEKNRRLCFKYNENHVFFKDMRLEKYTLEVRKFGQAEGAHKLGASARTSQPN